MQFQRLQVALIHIKHDLGGPGAKYETFIGIGMPALLEPFWSFASRFVGLTSPICSRYKSKSRLDYSCKNEECVLGFNRHLCQTNRTNGHLLTGPATQDPLVKLHASCILL